MMDWRSPLSPTATIPMNFWNCEGGSAVPSDILDSLSQEHPIEHSLLNQEIGLNQNVMLDENFPFMESTIHVSELDRNSALLERQHLDDAHNESTPLLNSDHVNVTHAFPPHPQPRAMRHSDYYPSGNVAVFMSPLPTAYADHGFHSSPLESVNGDDDVFCIHVGSVDFCSFHSHRSYHPPWHPATLFTAHPTIQLIPSTATVISCFLLLLLSILIRSISRSPRHPSSTILTPTLGHVHFSMQIKHSISHMLTIPPPPSPPLSPPKIHSSYSRALRPTSHHGIMFPRPPHLWCTLTCQFVVAAAPPMATTLSLRRLNLSHTVTFNIQRRFILFKAGNKLLTEQEVKHLAEKSNYENMMAGHTKLITRPWRSWHSF